MTDILERFPRVFLFSKVVIQSMQLNSFNPVSAKLQRADIPQLLSVEWYKGVDTRTGEPEVYPTLYDLGQVLHVVPRFILESNSTCYLLIG